LSVFSSFPNSSLGTPFRETPFQEVIWRRPLPMRAPFQDCSPRDRQLPAGPSSRNSFGGNHALCVWYNDSGIAYISFGSNGRDEDGGRFFDAMRQTMICGPTASSSTR